VHAAAMPIESDYFTSSRRWQAWVRMPGLHDVEEIVHGLELRDHGSAKDLGVGMEVVIDRGLGGAHLFGGLLQCDPVMVVFRTACGRCRGSAD
jgi:hypothetical protein